MPSGVTSLIDTFMTLHKEEYPLQGCEKSIFGSESLRKMNRKKVQKKQGTGVEQVKQSEQSFPDISALRERHLP